MTGMRPIVEIMFSDFITIAMDQLVNQAAKARYQFGGQASVPMVLRTPEGSGTGAAAQHSQSVEAWILQRPRPQGRGAQHARDAKGLLKTVHPRQQSGGLPRAEAALPDKGRSARGRAPGAPGQGRLQARGQGPVDHHLRPHGAALPGGGGCLAKEGIQAEVIDLRTLRPLDTATLVASAKRRAGS